MEGYEYGNRNPDMQQGIISGKVLPDYDLIDEFRANDAAPALRKGSFPNGQNDMMHNIMPGDMLIGMRHVRAGDRSETGTDFMECGVPSVSGYHYKSHISQAEVEGMFYWLGHAVTESRILNPNDPGRADASNQAVGTVKAGVHTVPWRSYTQGYKGDRVYWHLPRIPKFFPPARSKRDGDYAPDVYVPGTIPEQSCPMYGPFDPCDVSIYLAAAFSAMSVGKSMAGISDIPYRDALPRSVALGTGHCWSPIQETALALKFGLTGMMLTMVQVLIKRGLLGVSGDYQPTDGVDDTSLDKVTWLAEQLGLFNGGGEEDVPSEVLMEALAAVLFPHLAPTEQLQQQAQADFEKQADKLFYEVSRSEPVSGDRIANTEVYNHMRTRHVDLHFGGINNVWDQKTSRIVGILLSDASPGEDATIAFGFHTQ